MLGLGLGLRLGPVLVLGPGLVGVWCAWVAARLDATRLDAQLREWLGLCLMLGLVLGLALGLGLGLVPCLVRLGWCWWGPWGLTPYGCDSIEPSI